MRRGGIHTIKTVHKIMVLFAEIMRISPGFQAPKMAESEVKSDE